MTPSELIESLKKIGAVLTLEAGDKVKFQIPESAAHMIDLLAQCKAELIGILRDHGGRIAEFPHCPRCASYALYRKDNVGIFECQTCGLQNIRESLARRVQ